MRLMQLPSSCDMESYFFFRDNYNMLLKFRNSNPFFSKSPNTLYMERCQFSYKAFGMIWKTKK